MDLQFYGANCISITYKGTRLVVDDNLDQLGAKNVTKPDDVALCTMSPKEPPIGRLAFDGPGEYEVADISVIGIAARAHMEADEKNRDATMFKLAAGEFSVLVTGHIYPELDDAQLETIGMIDVLVVPVGGNGYTVDPVGALKLIKSIEPKLVVPTHYADKSLKYPVPQQELAVALKELAMEPKETVAKLKLKPAELSDITQLVVLERS
ncbi:MAG TPA: MBL fold metallo-hydrolase [Candidatus Saccharimonadales bacterium]|nr:MBL fold metallo-hydrolase [Candidatus Saccharimonadales bacterium]